MQMRPGHAESGRERIDAQSLAVVQFDQLTEALSGAGTGPRRLGRSGATPQQQQ